MRKMVHISELRSKSQQFVHSIASKVATEVSYEIQPCALSAWPLPQEPGRPGNHDGPSDLKIKIWVNRTYFCN